MKNKLSDLKRNFCVVTGYKIHIQNPIALIVFGNDMSRNRTQYLPNVQYPGLILLRKKLY
jgi:hypothetical protein